jgi:type IV pilus assembly protein PilV
MKLRNHSRGFTMLEVLISLLVMAFGLLGVAGLQAFSLKSNQTASQRLIAATLTTDVIDRMKSNYQGTVNGNYNQPNGDSYTVKNASCLQAAGCAPDQLALNDLAEWSDLVAGALPNGRGIVCLDDSPNDGVDVANPQCNASGTIYVVKIFWSERSPTTNAITTHQFRTAFNP